MIVTSGSDAYRQLVANVRARTFNMPSKQDIGHYVDGGIFPRIKPEFTLTPNSSVFTIGSCFAREVEAVLLDCKFDVPVSQFEIPQEELALPGPHLLNEYNAGTIAQRLQALKGSFEYGQKGIEITDKGAIDLFLHIGSAAVSMERLLERRQEIALLYQKLLSANVVVITLGTVESWFDNADQCYLNRAPSQRLVRAEPDRFEFHRMDVEDVLSRVSRGIESVLELGIHHIMITVSPVPVEATFMADGCPLANAYSKAVLRVCAELISKQFERVTYFPSFEIANSFGTAGLLDDNVHVQPRVVHHIMHYLLSHYCNAARLL